MADGSRNITFRIYDAATGGTKLWEETQTVATEKGLFNALLGSQTPFGAGVFASSPRYLAVQVAGEAEMAPRLVLAAVPFALRAADAEKLGGKDASAYALSGQAGTGDITKVAAGAGLTGGGESGDVSLAVAEEYRLPQGCTEANAPRVTYALLPGQRESQPRWVCGDAGDGDITKAAAGDGLLGGGETGDVTLSVNENVVQRRIGGACQQGMFIKQVLPNGFPVCEGKAADADKLDGLDSTAFARRPVLMGTWRNDNLDEPDGIAVDSAGYVYVTLMLRDEVAKFTPTGVFIKKWGGPGEGLLSSYPNGIAMSPGGNRLYVADMLNDRIHVFDAQGNSITKWGATGSGDGQLSGPRGVAVDSQGFVYVVDSTNNRVQKFDAGGNFIAKWGSQGSGDGQFNGPYGIAVGPGGIMYVARIQKFAGPPTWQIGTFRAAWGTQGMSYLQFDRPRGIAVGTDGYVYVVEERNNRVQVFSP